MNYEAVWKLMADLVAELRKSGETVPADVMKDLRSAKTMIEILKMDRSRSENVLRIEEYLNYVESYLVSAAKRRLGAEYVDEWTSKLLEAQRSEQPFERESTKFPVGLPRATRWIRIGGLKEFPPEKIRHLCDDEGLECRIEEDGCVLIFGEGEKVKRLVKKMVGPRQS